MWSEVIQTRKYGEDETIVMVRNDRFVSEDTPGWIEMLATPDEGRSRVRPSRLTEHNDTAFFFYGIN